MYSCEQDHPATAARTTAYDGASYLQPCATGRSLQLPAHHQPGQLDPAAAAVGSAVASGVHQQPRRAGKKKHGGAARPPPSRRSSTTVVATDVANFRAMVQELTGFPPAAVFRPLPRRVHAAASNPAFVSAAAAAGHRQGCGGGGDYGRGQGSATTTNDAAGTGTGGLAPPMQQPVMVAQSSPLFPPPGVFDGLSDIGSPVFDSWADLSIE